MRVGPAITTHWTVDGRTRIDTLIVAITSTITERVITVNTYLNLEAISEKIKMMSLIILVFMQVAWSFGEPQESRGGGSYSYSDTSGNRYSGAYGLKDGRVVQTAGDFPASFADTAFPGYGYGFGFPGDNFYPTYFANLENFLQEAFHSNLENQRLAYDAARKAFDVSSNQAGYYQTFATRLPQVPFNEFGGFGGAFGGFPSYVPFDMPNLPNSAFASSAAGPGFRQQVASINPANPNSPNVNINRVSHYSDPSGRGGYYSVSSKSFSSSSNVNGQEHNRRGAETVVNDNGQVTKYKVEN